VDISEKVDRIRESLDKRSYTQKIGFLGFIAGLILFFNHSHFIGFGRGLVYSIFTGVATGYTVERVGKKGVLTPVILTLVYLFFMLSSGCLMYMPTYVPQENMFTGEIRSGSWEGIRLEFCDKDELPWYYTELDPENKEKVCSTNKWNGSIFCKEYATNVSGT
jgi:hypothetical protein